MDGIANFRIRPIQKHIHASDMAKNKTRAFERPTSGVKIRAAQEDIYVLRITNSGLIYTCYPRGDCILANDSVRHSRLI